MRIINGTPLDDGVDEPWTCPDCEMTEENCGCVEYTGRWTAAQIDHADRLHDELRDRQWEERERTQP